MLVDVAIADELSDDEAKNVLRDRWREITGKDVGLPSSFDGTRWVRALPVPKAGTGGSSSQACLIKIGEEKRRHPDGLYVVVGETRSGAVADILGVEVCKSWSNFETKRHTYNDRGLQVRLASKWLREARTVSRQTKPIWQWAGMPSEPAAGETKVTLPVRWASVVFALKPDDYRTARQGIVPYANEYFCKHSSLGSWDAQSFKRFLRNATWADRFDRTFYNKRA